MLRKTDALIPMLTLRFLSLTGILPISINVKTEQIKIHRCGWKLQAWTCRILLLLSYGIYTTARLFQSLVLEEETNLIHLPLHFIMSTISLITVSWSLILFLQHPDASESIFNQLQISGPSDGNQGKAGMKKISRRSYALEEWGILVLPSSLLGGIQAMFTAISFITRDSLQFLYSALPEKQQTPSNFHYLAAFEGFFSFHYLAFAFYGIFFQIAFILNFSKELKAGAAKIKGGAKDIPAKDVHDYILAASKKGRCMALKLQLFNLVCSDIVFLWKLYFILNCTTLWFVGVEMFLAGKVILALLYTGMGTYGSTVYMFMYNRAFSLPDLMQRYKSSVLLGSQMLGQRDDRIYIVRYVKAIRNNGVREGDFRTMSRLFTPGYVDTIIRNVCTLLVISTN